MITYTVKGTKLKKEEELYFRGTLPGLDSKRGVKGTLSPDGKSVSIEVPNTVGYDLDRTKFEIKTHRNDKDNKKVSSHKKVKFDPSTNAAEFKVKK